MGSVQLRKLIRACDCWIVTVKPYGTLPLQEANPLRRTQHPKPESVIFLFRPRKERSKISFLRFIFRGGSVPQLCELIENVKNCPSPYFYCWLVVVIFFCFAVDLHNNLFKTLFFSCFQLWKCFFGDMLRNLQRTL